MSRFAALALAVAATLTACHPDDFVVVKLEAASGLPPIAQLTLEASDATSSNTATEPAAPNPNGIVFPESYVIATPASGAVNILVSGLDTTGDVIARGAGTAVASGSVQAVVITLSPTCESALDCDPDEVCSGSETCGDAGACVPSNGAVLPDGTGCGDDGGICQSGTCVGAQPCASDLDCDPQGVCAGAVFCSDGGACLPGAGTVLANGTPCGEDGGLCEGGGCVIPAQCRSSRDCDPQGICAGSVFCSDAGACLPGAGTVATNGTGCGEDGGLCEGGGCLIPYCGCGIVVPPEQCDFGADGGPLGLGDTNKGVCTASCRYAACGDGTVNIDLLADGGLFFEQCDWGSGADGGACTGPDGGCNSDTLPNHCRSDCLPARCGDAVLDTGERCDLGPPGPDGGGGNGTGSGCNATCSLFGQVTTLTGTGVASYQDGPLATAIFNSPWGITLIGRTLYVADEFNDLIRAVNLDAGTVSTLTGRLGIQQSIDGDAGVACLSSPVGVAPFQGGLALAQPTEVRLVTLTGAVTTLVGTSNISTTDGPFRDAGFVNLQAIAHVGLDLYVTDPPLGLRRLDMTSQAVTTVVPDGGVVTNSSTLSGVTYVDGGPLYVADSHIDEIQSILPGTNLFQYVAGDPGTEGFADGVGQVARFDLPAGMCTDGVSIYVADQLNGSMRQVVPGADGGAGSVTTLAGSGQSAPTPQNGTGRAATFNEPAACVWDPASGDVFVTDIAANTLRRIH